MKKIFKGLAVCAASLFLVGSLSGCNFLIGGEQDNVVDAYEIAVQEGFNGTRKEWIQSLKGADGKDGKDLDLYEVYQLACQGEDGFQGSFNEFLKEYFSVSVQEDNDTDMLAKNMTSVVSVQCGFDQASSKTGIASSAGSGVILNLDKTNGNATIITNYHVVYNADADNSTGIADYMYVYLYGATVSTTTLGGGDSIKASFVGGAAEYDIAVIQVSGSDLLKKSQATAATIGNSESALLGEKVFVMGNAAARGLSVTSGVLSVLSEEISISLEIKGAIANTTKKFTYRVMRTDAPINGGNSGGAMFDAKGNLIAIVNAKTVSDDVDNMGYALPINNAYAIYQNVLDNNGSLKIADSGVTTKVDSSESYFDENGALRIKETVLIDSVAFGAFASGSLKAGDQLLSVTKDGVTTEIMRAHQFEDFLLTLRVGDTFSVKVLRGNFLGTSEKTCTFTLTSTDFYTL